eukprot:TRINITY_DN631_c0_g1_i1.p1 TRINITY_DN631_c0_g1~~TRINITY_DN631_c0_g1_i1.p1  ORF type:complete len:452 (+),score=119.98 TRINITY_DN631_c0_g1_i1:662-2017(+)
MNPLTQVKNTQKITAREIASGASEEASWHAKYKDSAYIFVGGLPFTCTEGDLLAVFAQYGEVVDVNLVRDKATGKSRGFAFIAYQDQRSTVLCVDNLNGARIVGRIIKVDHVASYKRLEEEDPGEFQARREANGVCHMFQRGECKRGDTCKYSHNEERAANTGWGSKHDFDGARRDEGQPPRPAAPARNGVRDQLPEQSRALPAPAGMAARLASAPSAREGLAGPLAGKGRAEAWGPEAEEEREEETGRGRGGAGLSGANPWEGSSSIFAIMAEAPDIPKKVLGSGKEGEREEGRKRKSGKEKEEKVKKKKKKKKVAKGDAEDGAGPIKQSEDEMTGKHRERSTPKKDVRQEEVRLERGRSKSRWEEGEEENRERNQPLGREDFEVGGRGLREERMLQEFDRGGKREVSHAPWRGSSDGGGRNGDGDRRDRSRGNGQGLGRLERRRNGGEG